MLLGEKPGNRINRCGTQIMVIGKGGNSQAQRQLKEIHRHKPYNLDW